MTPPVAALDGAVPAWRLEDAGLNAAAPAEQRWLDGWLLRFNPGKAKRARCMNPLAAGRLPLADKLSTVQALYRRAGLDCLVRITPFCQPGDLDGQLAAAGWSLLDDTRVMACALHGRLPAPTWPDGVSVQAVDSATLAETVGTLRGTPPPQRLAHARRLAQCALPLLAVVLRAADGRVLACGQAVIEDDLVGLYDVFTATPVRGRGLARQLCAHLLRAAQAGGARTGYLQVDADNPPARQAYARLGFADVYAYHYRQAPD